MQELPTELIIHVLSFLDFKSVVLLNTCNKQLNRLILTDSITRNIVWRTIYQQVTNSLQVNGTRNWYEEARSFLQFGFIGKQSDPSARKHYTYQNNNNRTLSHNINDWTSHCCQTFDMAAIRKVKWQVTLDEVSVDATNFYQVIVGLKWHQDQVSHTVGTYDNELGFITGNAGFHFADKYLPSDFADGGRLSELEYSKSKTFQDGSVISVEVTSVGPDLFAVNFYANGKQVVPSDEDIRDSLQSITGRCVTPVVSAIGRRTVSTRLVLY